MLPQSAEETLDREFLAIRCRLIEVAAALDRISRAPGLVNDVRLTNIRRSLEVLAQPGTDRAENIQHIFSLPYAADWRQHWDLDRNA